MGVSFSSSEEIINPLFRCCDNCVKYVLNGFQSECQLTKWCSCKVTAINHTSDDFNSDSSD